MRKQGKSIIWPVYFDATKTRREGRKVPKNISVTNPTLAEVQEAAERLGLKQETLVDAAHSATPLRRTGRIAVISKGQKMKLLVKIAKEVSAIRQQAKK